MKSRPIIVAIDGPAGSGKSSISRRVAERLGWIYVNTGALYRSVGLVAEEHLGDVLEDEDQVSDWLKSEVDKFTWDDEKAAVFYGDRNLKSDLNSVKAGNSASIVAKMPKVRGLLLPVQRRWAESAGKGALVDGRDIGTVVFPDADVKIFMTASLEERAKRRLSQLERKGAEGATMPLEEIVADISERDERDAARGNAPLKQANSAVLFDNSNMTQDEAVKALIEIIQSYGLVDDSL